MESNIIAGSTDSPVRVDPKYEFNCPQYRDLSQADVDMDMSGDSFFDPVEDPTKLPAGLPGRSMSKRRTDDSIFSAVTPTTNHKSKRTRNGARPDSATSAPSSSLLPLSSSSSSSSSSSTPRAAMVPACANIVPKVGKTTDEIRMEIAQQEARELKKQQEEQRQKMKKILTDEHDHQRLPTHSTKHLTEPVEFKFRTEERIQSARSQTSAVISEPAAQPVTARSSSSLSSTTSARTISSAFNVNFKVTKGADIPLLTEPKPFRFATDERLDSRKATVPVGGDADMQGADENEDGPETPFAERMKRILKTPKRFHSKGKNEQKPELPPKVQPTLTQSVGMQFHSDDRIRGTNGVKSTAEREAEEIEKLRAQPFKARPVDPRVLDSNGDYGVPRIPKKALTEPKTPHFRTDSRSENIRKRESLDLEEDTETQFRAHEVNRKMFQGPLFVPKKSEHAPVIPESPMLQTKSRAQTSTTARPSTSGNDAQTYVPFKAQPIAVYSPIVIKHPEHKLEVQPFSLATDKRSEVHAVKIENLKKELEEREAIKPFKANPIMTFVEGPSGQPRQFTKDLTDPIPFRLHTEDRHSVAEVRLRERLEAEQRAEEEKRNFKAQPIMIDNTPLPKPAVKPPTECVDIQLHLNSRLARRQEFDARVKEEEKLKEELKLKREQERLDKENDEVRELRKQLVFKANPIPQYPNTPPALKSTKPLTEPKTPAFLTSRRSSNLKDSNA